MNSAGTRSAELRTTGTALKELLRFSLRPTASCETGRGRTTASPDPESRPASRSHDIGHGVKSSRPGVLRHQAGQARYVALQARHRAWQVGHEQACCGAFDRLRPRRSRAVCCRGRAACRRAPGRSHRRRGAGLPPVFDGVELRWARCSLKGARPMLMRDAWGRAWREGGWSGVDEADRELQMDERYAHYLLRFEATAVGEPQSRAGWIAHGAGVSAGVRAASSQRPKVSADVEDVLRGAAGP